MTSLLALWLLAAAPPSEADRLFREGKQLMKTKPAEACPRFERSFALDPALGTLLNLALCFEQTGRPASAWLRFNQAREWAMRTHEAEREKAAREHSEALSRRLSWVAISTARAVPGLEVEVGPHRLHLANATSLPVDPGKLEVRASAPGYLAWRTEVDAPSAGATLRLELPALEPDAPPAPPPVAAREAPLAAEEPVTLAPSTSVVAAAPARPSAAPGVALVISGATLIVAGVVAFSYSADVHARAQSQRVEVPSDLPPNVTRSEFDTARTLYPLSVVAMGVGAAAAGVGVFLLARTPAPVSMAVAPVPGGVALVAGGDL